MARSVAWRQIRRSSRAAVAGVGEVTTGVIDLADILQGYPELLGYNFADLQAAAHRALGHILDFVNAAAR
jgi:hypothetical protein